MIARVTILLPFDLFVREGDEQLTLKWAERGYEIRFYTPFEFVERPKATDSVFAPVFSLRAAKAAEPSDTTLIDGRRVAAVNVLRLDFVKAEFDRAIQSASSDPPDDLIFGSANEVLAKLRVYSRASQIKPLIPARDACQVTYLTDDGKEVEEEDGKKRSHFYAHSGFSFPAITPEIVSLVTHPDLGEPYVWDQLLLDSNALLPDVGGAIVMASAALETFIAWALDVLHQERELPPGLWDWIKTRDHFTKEPSVAEKFDTLLRIFTGRSLKDETELWRLYKELRNARNTLVHEGVATVGTTPVDRAKARELIVGAEKTIKWVEQLLPAARRRVRTEASGPFSRRLTTPAEATGLDRTGITPRAEKQNQGEIRIVRRNEDQVAPQNQATQPSPQNSGATGEGPAATATPLPLPDA
jgi:hypothetical protein